MKTTRLLPAAVALLFQLAPTPVLTAATPYQVGDLVENFSLVNRATGQPVQLTDFAGQIVLLDWFAWWCPFCQAAAPQLLTGIDEWYDSRGGNPAGLPVVHIGVNLQPGQESQTQNFVNRAGLDLVLQDFNRAVASRIAGSGQPIFAIINGVANSPKHRQWELLYSRLGYGETSFPIGEFRTAIDAVLAPVVVPPTPPQLSPGTLTSPTTFTFQITGEAGRAYRIESSSDLSRWAPVRSFRSESATETVSVSLALEEPRHFFRVVAE
jgi:thiol-disulfide isomerase/thioredoxin